MPLTMLGQMTLICATCKFKWLNMNDETASKVKPTHNIHFARTLPTMRPTKKVVMKAAMPRGLIA